MSPPAAPPAGRARLRAAPDAPAPLPARPPEVAAPGPGRGAVAAAALSFAAVLGYAVVRYAVVKGEPLASLPLWITNKAVAVFAVALLAAAAARPRAPWRRGARALALGAASLHGVASLALLRPAYYSALFEGGPGGRMTALGELALLCGAGALAAFAALRRPAPAAGRAVSLAAAAGTALVLAHCAALGAPGWLSPGRWPGGLPPMSLIGALLALFTFCAGAVAARRARRRAGSPPRGAPAPR